MLKIPCFSHYLKLHLFFYPFFIFYLCPTSFSPTFHPIFISGRNVHLVGTANSGQKQPFTKLEAGANGDKFPPFFIGYYQDKHYQSLEIDMVKEEMVRNKEKEKVDSSQPIPTLSDVMAIPSSLKLMSPVAANTSSVSTTATATANTVSSSAVQSPVTITPIKTPKKRGRPFGWRKVKGDGSTKSPKKAKKDVQESERVNLATALWAK